MLERFLVQHQVQMKTILEVMNMNATYKVSSQQLSKKQNSIAIRSILHIQVLVEMFLKYILKHSNICSMYSK